MEPDEDRRHIDGNAAHPRHRAVIIGGSDSEHNELNSQHSACASERSKTQAKKNLGEAREPEKTSLPRSMPRARIDIGIHEEYCTRHLAPGRNRRVTTEEPGGARLGSRSRAPDPTGEHLLVRRFRSGA